MPSSNVSTSVAVGQPVCRNARKDQKVALVLQFTHEKQRLYSVAEESDDDSASIFSNNLKFEERIADRTILMNKE